MQPKYQATVKFVGSENLGYFHITFSHPPGIEVFSAMKNIEKYPGFRIRENPSETIELSFNPNYELKEIFEEIQQNLNQEGITKISFSKMQQNTVYKQSEMIDELFAK